MVSGPNLQVISEGKVKDGSCLLPGCSQELDKTLVGFSCELQSGSALAYNIQPLTSLTLSFMNILSKLLYRAA